MFQDNRLESPTCMFHTTFQDHRTFGSEEDFECFTTYGRGGHLGHVTGTIYI